MGQKRANWLHNPCRLGGLPTLRSGGQSQHWRTKGQMGYITLAGMGVSQRFEAGDNIRGTPQVGRLATKPVRSKGSRTL